MFAKMGKSKNSEENVTNTDFTMVLTKGIFVKKPIKKKTTGSPAKKNPDKFCYEQYKYVRDKMEGEIQDIEQNAYKKTFSALIKFIKNCHSSQMSGLPEIPAAILVMGVNMPDHSNIFRLLEEQLHSIGLFATVKLQSKECNNFSSLMQKLVHGLVSKYQKETATTEGESVSKQACTFAKLLSCYESLSSKQYNVRQSPRKSSAKNSRNLPSVKSKPIVILLQDVEAFNTEVLQSLILNCNSYATKLPIVLVFGMASAMVTLHNILPQKTLSCLGIETFYSLTAIEYLTKILHQVVLSPENPFKIGPRVFRLIVDTVLYHDFSVTNITHMLKFCLTEHFYENDVSCLCCPPFDIPRIIQSLTAEHLAKLKNLPSLSRFLENNPEVNEKIKGKNFKLLLEDFLNKQHDHYQMMVLYLNCLHLLTNDLPGQPLGKHVRELYPLSFEENFTSLPAYQQAIKLLKLTSREELETKIKKCLDVLDEIKEPNDDIKQIKQSFALQLMALNDLNEDDNEKDPVTVNPLKLDKITSRAQLQETLKNQLKLRRSKFENCRESVVDFISSLFQKFISPTELPLYEVIYFDDVTSVKHHLMAVPRTTLHHDLVSPHIQLKCHCCKVGDNQEICASMPDICILYKLHLEYGKLINLYDWLQAFKSIKNCKCVKDSEEDKALNTRFMHSVSELQHLGLVKATKRKTDHVARLTFSSF